MLDPRPAQARRRRKLAGESIGGWIPCADCDGLDSNGAWMSWYEWLHQDGRVATQWPDGSCSDPELEELLSADARARYAVRQPYSVRWKNVLLRAIGRLLRISEAPARPARSNETAQACKGAEDF